LKTLNFSPQERQRTFYEKLPKNNTVVLAIICDDITLVVNVFVQRANKYKAFPMSFIAKKFFKK
jgi:hypothetical protein